MTARLDDALEAAGELVILAGAVEAAPDEGHNPGRGAADGPAVPGEGMTLTLPYVPARLVIEISDPAVTASVHAEPGAGHLALVRDSASGRTRAKAAGR